MKKSLILSVIVVTIVFAAPFIIRAAAFFFVGDNGYISIGNSSPQAPLDVSGAMYSRLATATSSSIDWNMGNVQAMTLSSSPTLTFSNGQAGGEYKLILSQDGTGGRTVTWPTNVEWAGGNEPTLTSDSSATDMLSFAYDGSRYLATYDADFKSAPSTLLNSLISYWKLDESSGNAADAFGGNTLVNHNTTNFASALINNGADFGTTNTNKYFDINSDFGINGGSLSISTWVKLRTEVSSGQYSIFQLEDGSNSTFYTLLYQYNGGSRRLRIDRGRRAVGDFTVDHTITLGTSAWHHVVVTYDGSTLTLYVDGANVGTLSTSGGGSSGPGPGFYLGTVFGTGEWASIQMDETSVWSRALTSLEVTELYNSGSGIQYPF